MEQDSLGEGEKVLILKSLSSRVEYIIDILRFKLNNINVESELPNTVIVKKDRGIVLTAFLIIASLLALLFMFKGLGQRPPSDLSLFSGILTKVLLAAGLVLIWMWKKIGLYLFAVSLLLFFYLPPLLAVENGLSPASPYVYVGLLIVTGILSGVLFLIFRRKWNLFS